MMRLVKNSGRGTVGRPWPFKNKSFLYSMKLHTLGDHKLVKLKSYTLELIHKTEFKVCVRKSWTIAIDFTLFLKTNIRVYSLSA